jgi:TonB family protein
MRSKNNFALRLSISNYGRKSRPMSRRVCYLPPRLAASLQCRPSSPPDQGRECKLRVSTLVVIIGVLFAAAEGGVYAQTIPVAEAADRAVVQSRLISPGSPPFHLQAKIVEKTNPGSDYKAEIEEFWVSPEKWQRTIQSPGFSQTLIVNGDTLSERNSGDYYPWWLRNLVTAIFDPLPMLPALLQSKAQIPKPNRSENATSCARFESKSGVPPVQISAFSVFCFEGSHGLLTSVVTPGYGAEFKDYRSFQEKRIARRLALNPEPGTTIEARVTELSELARPDASLFAVELPTPERERLKSVLVSEVTFRGLIMDTPDIVWPSVRDGRTSGVLSLYVSVDRSGHVQEAWPLNSDNPQLDDAARAQVKKWQLKPAVVNGVPVQVESVLTFAFTTRIKNVAP